MKRPLLAIAGLLGVLVLSVVLDSWLREAQFAAGRSFDFTPLLWWKMAFLLIFAAAILALAWAVLRKTDKSILVSSVYIVVGLIVTAATTFPVSAYIAPVFRIEFLYPVLLATTTSPTGFAANAGAFMLMMGLASLVLRTAPGILRLTESKEPMATPSPTADTPSRAR